MNYKALVIEENDGKFSHSIKELPISNLKEDELLVKINYSALNYKDALSFSGNKGVTKNYPHTPGIDGAGVIENSSSSDFKKGDRVLVTSYDLGMNTNGALAEFISIPSSWAIKVPQHISLSDAACMGTAALTAAIGLDKLQTMGLDTNSRLLLTGASGAVGVFVLAIANKLGYKVDAISSKESLTQMLKDIGASEIYPREFIDINEKRPLLKPTIDFAYDTVGGDVLANLLKMIKPEGSVAACGNAAGFKLDSSVFPFILRGVSLLGVDSAALIREKRVKIWDKLFNEWFVDTSKLHTLHNLEEVPQLLQDMLDGKSSGRKVIKI